MRIVFEKVPKPRDASFACLHFKGKVFHCPYHQHPEIEILHIERSSGRTVIGDTPGTFRPGQFYLFPSNLPHLFHNTLAKGTRRTEAWSRIVQFLPDCLGDSFWSLPETQTISRLFQRASRGLLWERQTARSAITMMDGLFSSCGATRIARLIELLEFLAPSCHGQPLASPAYSPIQSPVDSARLGRVLDYVDHGLGDHLDAETAAKRAGLSPSGFSRFFRRHMRCPFIGYVVGQRVTEAKRLLIETDLTIVEICFRCGFENLSNFNRHFRALCNCTPSEFRKRIAVN